MELIAEIVVAIMVARLLWWALLAIIDYCTN